MKKIIYIIICMSFLLILPACRGDVKPDIAALGEKMGRINPDYSFGYFNTFVFEDTARVFFSLEGEDNALLSLSTDNSGAITCINITAGSSTITTDAQKLQLASLFAAAAEAYTLMTEKEKTDCLEKLSFDNPQAYFTDLFEQFRAQRYIFTFSSNSECISLDIAYSDIIQAEKNPTDS